MPGQLIFVVLEVHRDGGYSDACEMNASIGETGKIGYFLH